MYCKMHVEKTSRERPERSEGELFVSFNFLFITYTCIVIPKNYILYSLLYLHNTTFFISLERRFMAVESCNLNSNTIWDYQFRNSVFLMALKRVSQVQFNSIIATPPMSSIIEKTRKRLLSKITLFHQIDII